MTDGDGYIDTLRLSDAQLLELLDSLDHSGPSPENADRPNRRSGSDIRLPFRHARLHLTIDHPGGGQSPFVVAGRNLTPRGLGFLHGNFLHTGTMGKVNLPQTVGGFLPIRCTVIWCRHLRDHIHEAAIRFERPIDLWRHIESAEAAADLTTRIDPTELKGRVHVLSASDLFRDLMAQELGPTNLDLKVSDSTDDAAPTAQTDPPELVLLHADFDNTDVPAQVRALRDAPIFCPIVLVTGEPSAQRIQPARDAGADGVMRMPFQPMQLLAVLLEWLTVSRANADCEDSNGLAERGPEFAALYDRYVTELDQDAAALTEAIAADDFERARALCRKIAETGGVFGLPRLSDTARKALTQLDSCYSIEESTGELQRLLQQVRKVSLDHAGASQKQAA
ncbi:MAG: response regulator [Planctomycetota bacterium]|nr:MAG: response regulator [Planctomycetota bacterium]